MLVLYEENNVFRQIFLDGRKPIEDPCRAAWATRPANGTATMLVVDTVGFTDQLWLDAMGHPKGPSCTSSSASAGAMRDTWRSRSTIDDPGAYTKPFTYTVKRRSRPTTTARVLLRGEREGHRALSAGSIARALVREWGRICKSVPFWVR